MGGERAVRLSRLNASRERDPRDKREDDVAGEGARLSFTRGVILKSHAKTKACRSRSLKDGPTGRRAAAARERGP